MSVSAQFKRDWLCAALQPNPATHDPFDAIIDLAAHHAFVNSKCHRRAQKLERGRRFATEKIEACRFPISDICML
jgi:hypothetical protein